MQIWMPSARLPIQADSIGEWVIDKENDGTPEPPILMPFVGYSEMLHNFIDDVFTFEESNKDMELTRYGDILKDNGHMNRVRNL